MTIPIIVLFLINITELPFFYRELLNVLKQI